MTEHEILALVAGGWQVQEATLGAAEAVTGVYVSNPSTRLPRLELAHQSYVTGFLSGLVAAGALPVERMEALALAEFDRRDRDLARGRR